MMSRPQAVLLRESVQPVKPRPQRPLRPGREQNGEMHIVQGQKKSENLREEAHSLCQRGPRLHHQITVDGITYLTFEQEQKEAALQAVSDGRQVLVRRLCPMCRYDIYESPSLLGADALCSLCEQALKEQWEKEAASADAAQQAYYDLRAWDNEQHRLAQEVLDQWFLVADTPL